MVIRGMPKDNIDTALERKNKIKSCGHRTHMRNVIAILQDLKHDALIKEHTLNKRG